MGARVQLRDFLRAVGETYDASAGFDTPAQSLLADAADQLSSSGPIDFVIKASGGQRPLGTTDTPWIGFFDPDESTDPKDSIYVVWILRASGDAWTLSLMMGTEGLAKRMKDEGHQQPQTQPRERRLLAALSAEATRIRKDMPPEVLRGWDSAIDLGKSGLRQRRYEAATVMAWTCPLDVIPDEATLQARLSEICLALQAAIDVRRGMAISDPRSISTAGKAPTNDPREYDFNPGTDSSIEISARQRPIIRTTRHEGGLRRYGEWLISRGFTVATNVYPRDFLITGESPWIGEYKVVYGPQVARASREAHSQLKEYRFFLHPDPSPAGLLAVFSAPLPLARVAWLNSEGIAVVWWSGSAWNGCLSARAAGLCD